MFTSPFMITAVGPSSDWKVERDRIDLGAVISRYLGPAPDRRGVRGKKLWWHCPFHEDRNPSFCVEPGKPWWTCFGCGEHGDAVKFVMVLEGTTFPGAVASLLGGTAP
jgi:DNA primase